MGPGLGAAGLTVIEAERRVDEGGRGVKEDAEIEGGHVVSLDSVVLDGHVAVVVGPRVHVPAAVGRVQHVREARFLQPVAVQRGRPGRGERSWWTTGHLNPALGENSRVVRGLLLSIPISNTRPALVQSPAFTDLLATCAIHVSGSAPSGRERVGGWVGELLVCSFILSSFTKYGRARCWTLRWLQEWTVTCQIPPKTTRIACSSGRVEGEAECHLHKASGAPLKQPVL